MKDSQAWIYTKMTCGEEDGEESNEGVEICNGGLQKIGLRHANGEERKKMSHGCWFVQMEG